jgi:hypothetical protein
MNPLYVGVASRAGHRCEYCHAPEAVFNFPFEVEHIVPIARGGTSNEANLAMACRSCNLRKAIHLSGEDLRSGEMVRLFRPREETWGDHFAVEEESDDIRGLTPTGRATTARLDMNSPAQRAARRQWRRLGFFP